MKVVVQLADAGSQDPVGKLNLLGLGWFVTTIGPQGLTPDTVVAVFIEAPWDQCNRPMRLALDLLSEDGQSVVLPTPAGDQPLRLAQEVVIAPPTGAPNGSPGQVALMVKINGGLPLTAGCWYRWQASLDDETEEGWSARFFVQRQPSQLTFGSGPVGAV